MGLAAADAGDPSGGEQMLPALHPHLADRAEGPPHPPHPLSPWRKKTATMAAVVPVEGAEDRGEHGVLSCETEQQPTTTTTVALNHLSPCTKSHEFDIDWGQYLENDACMLTLGESGDVVPDGPLLPLLTQEIGSSIQLNDIDAAPKTNDVDVVCQPDDESECDPFDNEEEYVGVDDENMYDITVPITIAVTDEAVVMPEAEVADENMYDEAEVMQHVQEEAEVADIDPLQFTISHDLENPVIREGALFPEIAAFRKAIRQHAVLADFEFANVKTDKTRFIAKCAYEKCPWRIHASRLHGQPVIMMHHNRLWYRCGFGEASKVDYLTNNISESFNKQIKDFKALNQLEQIKDFKTQWVQVDLGYKIYPPIQEKRPPGRPRVQRIRGFLEPGRKVVKCKRCKQPGHFEKTCKVPPPIYPEYVDEQPQEQTEEAPHEQHTPSKRKRSEEEQDVLDDEPIANYKRNRTTPTKQKSPPKKATPGKKVTPAKKAATPAKKTTPAKKAATPAKKAATPGKKAAPAKKAATPAKKAAPGKKASVKKKTPAKNGKKKKPEIVAPSTSEAVLQPPTVGTKRSLLWWIGG